MIEKYLNMSLHALWHYLNSWRSDNGLLGQAVSYWEWAPAVVAPHSMHAWPIAFGLIDLYERGAGEATLEEARRLCNWYIEDRVPNSNALAWAGGETPRKRTGDILQSAPIIALAKLAVYDRSGPWLKRAIELRDVVLEQFWNGRTVSYVGNHGAYMLAAEAMLEQAGAPGASSERTKSMLRCIERTVYRRGSFSGAVAQADFDPRVFDIYVGKALFGLALYGNCKGVKSVFELMIRIGDYLLRRVDELNTEGEGLCGFLNWRPRMVQSRFWGALRRLHRDLAGMTLQRRVEAIKVWDIYGPAWVARGALVSMGLHQAARILNRPDYEAAALKVDHWLSLHQDATGGVRNSFFFLGDPEGGDLWQDVVRPVRWNSYVFAAWALNENVDSWAPPRRDTVTPAYEVVKTVRGVEGRRATLVETSDYIDFIDVFEEPLRVNKRVVREEYRDSGGNAQRPEYARNWVPKKTHRYLQKEFG